MAAQVHPLAALLDAAAAGRFVTADGGWHRVPLWRPRLEAIVSFTGHAVLAPGPDVSDARLVDLGVDGLGGAHDPRLISALAGPDGWIDSLDVLLAGRGTGDGESAPRLVERPDLAERSTAEFAARLRCQPRVLGYATPDRRAVAVVCRRLAWLTELSLELEPEQRGAGGGAAFGPRRAQHLPVGRTRRGRRSPGMRRARAPCWQPASNPWVRCNCSAAPGAESSRLSARRDRRACEQPG